MVSNTKSLNAIARVGGTILTIGIVLFLIGLIVSDSSMLTSMGIGITTGAVFIFLIGLFFIASEEMVEKSRMSDNVAVKRRVKKEHP